MKRPARSKPAADAAPTEPAARPAVSISAVAQRAGVSIATVSRVTNGVANKASPATVARVQEAIAALGYRPMGAGRALRRRESRLVAVLAANLANPAMAAIAAAAEVALRNAGYVMVLCDTHDEPELQDEYLLEMRAQYACGLVLLGAVDSPVLRQFNASQEPLIFVNRRNPVPGGQGRYVGIDHEQAGRDVANWFADSQMKSVALIHARLASSATAGRVQGFRAQLSARGLAVPGARIQTLASADHLQIGYKAMQKIIRPGLPDAVFCTSDLIAYGAYRAAAEHGALAGRDYALVGFDDSPLNPWIAPWLHAVRVPYDQYGAAIARILRAAPDAQQDIVLSHQLIIRPASS
jgi:LacI family transcriptional regulator